VGPLSFSTWERSAFQTKRNNKTKHTAEKMRKTFEQKSELLQEKGWNLMWKTVFHGWTYHGYEKDGRNMELSTFMNQAYFVKPN
jgi:hypothetical protein